MSTNLHWRKITPEKVLGKSIKYFISQAVFGHDGSLGSGWVEISKETINTEYLKGVRDTTQDEDLKKEIIELLELLDKYESIEIALIN